MVIIIKYQCRSSHQDINKYYIMTTKRTKLPYWKDRQKSDTQLTEANSEAFSARVKALALKLEKILSQAK